MRNLNYKASGIYIAKGKPFKINKAIKNNKSPINYYKPGASTLLDKNKSRAGNYIERKLGF